MAADCKSAEVTLRRFESAPLHFGDCMEIAEISENQLYWLAGILEGEGSFLKGPPSAPNRPVISMLSTDEDVIAKVASLMNVSYWGRLSEEFERNGWKKPYAVHLRGSRAVELMLILKPLMGTRRQQQIEKAIEGFKPKVPLISEEDAMEMVRLYCVEKKKVVDLAQRFGIGRTLVYFYIKRYMPIWRSGSAHSW